MQRSSGVFLSISSLPSKYGIGTLGKEAYKFVDFLKESGFTYWQILPFNPTGFGNSPYQSFSTFAGNPYYIDLDFLKQEGFLSTYDLKQYKYEDNEFVNYSLLYKEKFKILRKAYKKGYLNIVDRIKKFSKENEFWLEDYCLFMALKDHFNGCSFLYWENKIKKREEDRLAYYKELLKEDIEFYRFIQYIFYEQLSNLVNYMDNKGIYFIGDLPIYVSMDSSDVWANHKLFSFNKDFTPKLVAGVPPDYFSEAGQLWGNPIYNYKEMEKDGYNWWIQRIKNINKYCKIIRIDHFRGFEAFYTIKYGEETAIKGKWKKGPGINLFSKIKDECPDAFIIAEDLGIITSKVRKLIKECGYPGMKILQFAFDLKSNNPYLPKNHTQNSVCYIGTHDNQTLQGYVNNLSNEQANYIKKCFAFKEDNLRDYLIRGLFKSKSNLCIINATDMLYKDDNYRMNTPSTLNEHNWAFRLNNLKDLYKSRKKYYKLNHKYKRI